MIEGAVTYAGRVFDSTVSVCADDLLLKVGESYGKEPDKLRMRWVFRDSLIGIEFRFANTDFMPLAQIDGDSLTYFGFGSGSFQRHSPSFDSVYLEIIEAGLSNKGSLEIIRNLVNRGAVVCRKLISGFSHGMVYDFRGSPGSLMPLARDDALLAKIQHHGFKQALVCNERRNGTIYDLLFVQLSPASPNFKLPYRHR